MAISSNFGTSDNIELTPINKSIKSGLNLTPKMKRAANTKKLQFTTPEYSAISVIPSTGMNRMIAPNRRREEAMVMANLRKRVAAVDLSRKAKASEDPNANDTGQSEPLDNRPLLPKISSRRDLNNGEESPKPLLQDKDFILDCLCWHNEYRARHGASALTVSPELCEHAQNWANHLASTNEFYYRSEKSLGQNLFCCPISALVTDLTGQEVASYWYSTVRRYNYFKEPSLLHTNVNAGHFTQIVWRRSKYFGVGKATSRTGKIFVVAYYYPPGNVVGQFQDNVLPPIMDQDGHQPPIDLDTTPIASILKSNSSGSGSTN
ncbi:uncharacterized protein LOC129606647 [Condylostylus longicornis]|uniref:uncharacterized protein LOC129606647 n=1 Tax=Condylostylus longicornis TaxID=2530218 RepID=UPI00244E4D6A|nr:uncharacterized protein LOC129606647 [Condylostylus longicornis]XP_055373037.1 uncharacterized protein LOC129606647 [Condylostylus longicornis]XP_055373038.1 uncharacterized protein LOC129606647 [Condylostylus longicornis]